ncbi:ArsR family transcriptional regulator [Halobacillus trueperi]|uniref:Helix-turn-helix domain-containing protein n=2 Tax=Halobacillus TaxID=45667 RepID=A0A1H0Q8K9_HALAD|nr:MULTISPECIES: winged helix-turn-helix domain-containing protein [Halobacillus]RDY72474.1 ArsR family transcriptional regulator [Halobacillus trueperi]SDP13721.1 Helix-turn-helix domain-containing protein [Halobacillus aidingensis]
MELFSMSLRKRETYQVEVKHSLLWEAALGIAAITNERLLETLDYTEKKWQTIKKSLSTEILDHLEMVQEKNTWKTILLLLHEKDMGSVEEFNDFVDHLDEEELRYIAIPYLGKKHQEDRRLASQGDQEAVARLQDVSKDNAFFPRYIAYISQVDAHHLKSHIQEVMTGWYEAVIQPDEAMFKGILERDAFSKKKRIEKLEAEDFVEWATHGIRYMPEPSVYKVIMIPQFIYRPWNVEADIEGAKIFYYPVANESIQPNDPYVPDQMLVQKFKALGDENRLRMLKILMGGGRTLKEMTEEIGMGKTTVYHHLKLLKSARLIVAYGPRYHVSPRAWEMLPKELELFLGEEK